MAVLAIIDRMHTEGPVQQIDWTCPECDYDDNYDERVKGEALESVCAGCAATVEISDKCFDD